MSYLGLVALLTETSITALAMMGKDVPPALPALGGTTLEVAVGYAGRCDAAAGVSEKVPPRFAGREA